MDFQANQVNTSRSWQRVLAAAALTLGMVGHGAAASAPWPDKPIRIVVPVAPGSAIDVVARLLAPEAAQRLGVPVLVENRPGGDMSIGSGAVARSSPDGYTWLMTSITMPSNTLIKSVNYDARRDFVPVANVADGNSIAVVPPALGVRDMREFVNLAKQQPGMLNYAIPAHASLVHLNTVMLTKAAGLQMEPVGYQGAAPAMTDLLSNRVNFMMAPPSVVAALIADGKLIALGTAGRERSSLVPEVPTMRELGYPDVSLETWTGIFMPAGVPDDIVRKVADVVQQSVNMPAFAEQLKKIGFAVPAEKTHEAFQARYLADLERLPGIFKIAGIEVQGR